MLSNFVHCHHKRKKHKVTGDKIEDRLERERVCESISCNEPCFMYISKLWEFVNQYPASTFYKIFKSRFHDI